MIFLFIVIFLIYFVYQSQYIFGGDSAEFVTTALTYSIPHPPGYPLYTILEIIFIKIFFFLSPLKAINLISILSHLSALYFMLKILKELGVKNFFIIIGLSFYSFILTTWLYNIIPEVYALNNFLISALIFFGLKFHQTRKIFYRKLFFIVFGLGLSHHHSIVIFLIPFLILNKNFFSFDILFSLIFIPFYLYPPIASYFNPPIDWENSKTFSGLFRLFTRYSYGTFSAYFNSVPDLINQLTTLFSSLILIIGEFKPLGVFFILFGIFSLNKKNLFLFNYFSITFFLYLIFLYLTNFNLSYSFSLGTFERYLIGLYLILSIFFVLGIDSLYQITSNLKKKMINFKTSRLIIPSYYLMLILFLMINFYNNFRVIYLLKSVNHFEKLAKTILEIPEKNSILLLNSDLTYFPISYFYYYLKNRSDIKLIFPPMFSREYYKEKVKKEFSDINMNNSNSTVDFIKINRNKNIYTEIPYNEDFVPIGLLWRYEIKKNENNQNLIIKTNFNFWLRDKNLPTINKDLKKIMFLNSLSEFYQERLMNFIRYLVKIKKYKELNSFLNQLSTIYDKKDYQYFSNLTKKYFQEEKLCQKLSLTNQRIFCL
mgnify:CR=1 FL=1